MKWVWMITFKNFLPLISNPKSLLKGFKFLTTYINLLLVNSNPFNNNFSDNNNYCFNKCKNLLYYTIGITGLSEN